MALKPYREPGRDDMTWFMDEVAERGGVVVVSTGGSGAAVDQGAALVTYAASQSGKLPVGILMQDMVNKDLTQTHLDFYKDEVQKGGKVLLWKSGKVTTNMIYPGLTVTAGTNAYLGPSGLLQTAYVNTKATPIVGVFVSSKDADGYAMVDFSLPQATNLL